MITIYHNPRCRKSREALQLVERSGLPFEVVDYQKEPLSPDALKAILKKLGITAEALLRKNEALWKERYKGQTLTEEELVDLMLNHPRLMERPILVRGERALIGRPPERVMELL
jgi:arsenate reductase